MEVIGFSGETPRVYTAADEGTTYCAVYQGREDGDFDLVAAFGLDFRHAAYEFAARLETGGENVVVWEMDQNDFPDVYTPRYGLAA